MNRFLVVGILVTAFLVMGRVFFSSSNDQYSVSTAEASYRKPEQESLQVPGFLQDYIDFHNEYSYQGTATSKDTTTKYLIWQCLDDQNQPGCGGTGDRLKGIVSAFYMAVCSRRILLLDWPQEETRQPLSSYLKPHKIDWQVPPERILTFKIIGTFSKMHGYNSPVLKDLQLPARLLNETHLALRTNRWYQDEMPDPHWYGGTNNPFQWSANQSHCLQEFWAQEVPHQQYQDPHYLFRTAFSILFRFSTATQNRCHQIQQAAQLPIQSPYMALHIRAGGQRPTFDDPGRHTSQDEYLKFYHCTKHIQQAISDRCPSQTTPLPAYVASDNANTKQWLLSLDQNNHSKPTTVHALPDLMVYHIDKSHHQIDNPDEKHSGALTVWAELQLLSEASCLVQSTSGFSQVARWLQSPPRCVLHFDDCFGEHSSRELLQVAIEAATQKLGCNG